MDSRWLTISVTADRQLIKPLLTMELDLLSVSKLWIEISHLRNVPYITYRRTCWVEGNGKLNPEQKGYFSDFKTEFILSGTF